jgi:DNA-binding transcriptional LysR family regulator
MFRIMKYWCLSTFLTVVEKGSLLSAAKALNISVSTVSAHVDAVEAFFGVKLLERSVEGVALTKAGELAFDKVSSILRQMDELKATISKKPAEPIRVAFRNVPGISVFPKVVEAFKRKNPAVEIYAKIKNESECIDLMGNGDVDIAMICYDDGIDLKKYNYKLIGVDNLVLALNRNHQLAERDTITLKELRGVSLIGLSTKSGITKSLKKALKARGYDLDDLNFVAEVGGVSNQLDSVTKGIGAAITSQIAAKYITSAKDLKILGIVDLRAERNIYLLYSKVLVNPKALEFAEVLAKRGAKILGAPT